MWKKLAQELESRGDLTPTTSEALAIACRAYGDYRLASDVIEKEGMVITTATTVKQHPMVVIQKQHSETLARYLDNLLLLPKGKGKIVGKLTEVSSELDALMADD
jgi:P27 family predicted phage terminase small subunit